MKMIAEEDIIMITRLYLMPTQQCNCACDYCYIPFNEKHKKGDSVFIKKVVGQFINELEENTTVEAPEIRFIGGEPYLEHKTMCEVSNMFLDKNGHGKIIINTNGTLINETVLNQFKSKHLNKIHHIVSLDGKEETHNKRRKLINGRNTFNETVKGIKLLQSYNIPVYINMVLDDFSVEDIDNFMKYLKSELGIHQLSVSFLFNRNKPLNSDKKFELIKETYEKADINKIHIGGHHRLILGKLNKEFKCKAGEKTILLSSDKAMYACQRFVGTEAPEYFTEKTKFSGISCKDCVDSNCYSDENNNLAERIMNLYKEKYPQYSEVNSFDKILFGVL